MKAWQNKKIEELKKYFEKQKNVLLAFVFGSFIQGRAMKESDVDIGIYLKDEKQDDSIKSDISRILGREVNFVYMYDDTPATLTSNVFETGIPLSIKDKGLYWDIYLSKSAEAADFAEFAKDYQRIYRKAKLRDEALRRKKSLS